MIHEVTLFLERWSPHIWLFGSIFGVFMSGMLLKQAHAQRIVLQTTDRADTSRFWFRHSASFFSMHFAYLIVGILTVAEIRNDWVSLLILIILVGTPLMLVYRSYDSLRLNSSEQAKRGG